VRVKRGRKVLKAKRVQAGAGTHSVTVRSKKLKQGRYTVVVLARDAFGNRSKPWRKRLWPCCWNASPVMSGPGARSASNPNSSFANLAQHRSHDRR